MKEPSIAMIEFKSIAKGIIVTDVIAKKSPVRLLDTHPVCPGKYMLLFCGEVADVEEAINAGKEAGKTAIVNELFLPFVHESIIPAISGTREVEKFDALGIVETFSISTCVKAADMAAKEAPVEMVEIRLANGLGGKGYFIMTGKLSDVEASMEVAKNYVSSEGMLAASEIIAAPHPDLIKKGIYW